MCSSVYVDFIDFEGFLIYQKHQIRNILSTKHNALLRVVILQRNNFPVEVTFNSDSSLKGFIYDSQDEITSVRGQ